MYVDICGDNKIKTQVDVYAIVVNLRLRVDRKKEFKKRKKTRRIALASWPGSQTHPSHWRKPLFLTPPTPEVLVSVDTPKHLNSPNFIAYVMSFTSAGYLLHFGLASQTTSARSTSSYSLHLAPKNRKFTMSVIPRVQKSIDELLVVVGGGAAGVYGAIRAKTLAPCLNVLVIEKGKPLSKVKISGGGRCNVTNGHCPDNMALAENYPRGNRELRGAFFNMHGPIDTMHWFIDHGVDLKTEEDGRVFPVSNSSSSIIDCLLSELKCKGVSIQTGKTVTSVCGSSSGKFLLRVEKQSLNSSVCVEADYLLIASGSNPQGYNIATQLGHSVVTPRPSLFTFKVDDLQLKELSGVTFPKVNARLKLENMRRNIPNLTQVGPMLVTHWGLSGPVILRLSAWGARDLFDSGYRGQLLVDFVPDFHVEDLKSIMIRHRNRFAKQKVLNSCPTEFGLVKRFWKYLLDREGLSGDTVWAAVLNSSLFSIAHLLKTCSFIMTGKGQFKDEFVTAGGVPLSEISLKTMESKIHPRLFFAGEVLNVDGLTGSFNFQNAWTGGFIAGTSIARQLALFQNNSFGFGASNWLGGAMKYKKDASEVLNAHTVDSL